MQPLRLRTPLIAAPMAGGPSTPELVAAIAAEGGYGYLAAGYRTAQQVQEAIEATRRLTDRPFGVNVFVPAAQDPARDADAVERYRNLLDPLAEQLGTEIPQPRWDDTDDYDAKIAMLLDSGVHGVSFTFGCPAPEVVERLHEAGIEVTITVTSADEALAAVRVGADQLCVQGAQAGGHRSTHRVTDTPNTLSAAELLGAVRAVTSVPLVAAGGVATAADVEALLESGAAAVQCGTAFLRTAEAGTNPTHRAALADASFDRTAVTRAYSGRPARGLVTDFIEQFGVAAPAVFPIVDQLTKPIRAAAGAAGRAQELSLWAGTGWQRVPEGDVADVVAALVR